MTVLVTFQGRDMAIRRQARIDPLSGLSSHGALEDPLVALDRSSSQASLLMCDVDHFTTINDTYGHARGDELPRQVARKIQTAMAGNGRTFRYGGEDFLVVLDGTPYTTARAVPEYLREQVARSSPAGLSVTVSHRWSDDVASRQHHESAA